MTSPQPLQQAGDAQRQIRIVQKLGDRDEARRLPSRGRQHGAHDLIVAHGRGRPDMRGLVHAASVAHPVQPITRNARATVRSRGVPFVHRLQATRSADAGLSSSTPSRAATVGRVSWVRRAVNPQRAEGLQGVDAGVTACGLPLVDAASHPLRPPQASQSGSLFPATPALPGRRAAQSMRETSDAEGDAPGLFLAT